MPEIGNNAVTADTNLVDESFSASQSECYYLSIQMEPDRFSFCVFNIAINKYIVRRNYPLYNTDDLNTLVNECHSIFDNDELLRLRYKRSSHLWISPRCTFVPDYLFDSAETDSYLTFNHGTAVGELTMQNHIKSARLYSAFSCPEALMALLRQYQPNIICYHHATPLIESVIAEISSSNKIGLAVYFYANCLDIVVAKSDQLLFYNTFQITAPEDSVYYLAGVSNLFQIDLSSTRLMYAGNAKQIPPEVSILDNYVERIDECDFVHLNNLYGCE